MWVCGYGGLLLRIDGCWRPYWMEMWIFVQLRAIISCELRWQVRWSLSPTDSTFAASWISKTLKRPVGHQTMTMWGVKTSTSWLRIPVKAGHKKVADSGCWLWLWIQLLRLARKVGPVEAIAPDRWWANAGTAPLAVSGHSSVWALRIDRGL